MKSACMIKVPVLALCLLAFAFLMVAQAAEQAEVKEIDVQAAAELLKNKPADLIILDVRTPDEYRGGHIANARNMDFFGGSFDQDALGLPKEGTILLYCRSGLRSAGAADILKRNGQQKILHMHEGLEAWERAGLPVEK